MEGAEDPLTRTTSQCPILLLASIGASLEWYLDTIIDLTELIITFVVVGYYGFGTYYLARPGRNCYVSKPLTLPGNGTAMDHPFIDTFENVRIRLLLQL